MKVERSQLKASRCLPVALAVLGATAARAQTASTITSNISNALVQNDYLWLESHLTQATFANAPGTFTAHVWITSASLSFTYNSVPYTIPLPNAQLTFSSSNGSTPTISYVSTGSGFWNTGFPTSGTTNPFLTGTMYQVPAALNGFTIAGNGASLSQSFSTDYSAGAVTLGWQWSAAQYTQTASPNALGVTAADVQINSQSYHAGTPYNLVAYVIAGGTGGGGSNYTGSNSGTATLTPSVLVSAPFSTSVPEPSTWAAIGFIGVVTAGSYFRRRNSRSA